MSESGSHLQVVYYWRKHLLGYEFVRPRNAVSVGPTTNATFVAPAAAGQPKRRLVIRPARGGFRLRVWPGMAGQMRNGTEITELAGLFDQPAPKTLFWRRRFREVELPHGATAELVVHPESLLRLKLRFTSPPEALGRPPYHRREPLVFKTAFWTATTVLVSLILVLLVGDRVPQIPPPITMTAERAARTVALLQKPAMKEAV